MYNTREFFVLSRMKPAGSPQDSEYNNKTQVSDSITLWFSGENEQDAEATITWTRIGGELSPGISAYADAWEAICSDERLLAMMREHAYMNITPDEMAEKLVEIGFTDKSELPPERPASIKPFATVSWEYSYFRNLIAKIIGVNEYDLSARLVRSVEAAMVDKFKNQMLCIADKVLPELIFSALRGVGEKERCDDKGKFEENS